MIRLLVARRAPKAAADPAVVARVLDRVATLVAAGTTPARAWALVGTAAPGADVRGGGGPGGGGGGGGGGSDGVGRAVGAGGGNGGVRHPAWADVRAVMAVAERTGSPVAPTLRVLAGALRRTAAADRAVRVALAGPRTSANVVLALPVLGVLLAALCGVDTFGVLLGSPLGWCCTGVALALVSVGRVWSRRLVRAVEPDGRIVGVLLDAWAVALSGGGSWSGAGASVRSALRDRVPSALEAERLAETLALARRAGVPAAALLRSAAEDLRDDAAGASLAAAERLGVRLVLPLGVCVLPAFVLVGVVPVVVALLSSTVADLG